MRVTVTTNAKQVGNRMTKRQKKLETQTRQGLLDLSQFIMERAKFYAGEVSGPYSKGTVTGKLQNSIGRSVGTKTATVFQKSNAVPYGPMQETGLGPSSFTGWRYVPRKGMVKAKRPPYHPGFKGKHFMEKAARDGRAESGKILRNKINVAMRV